MTTSRQQVAARSEIGATTRVYAREWVLEHRANTSEAAQEWLTVKYAGRLRAGDWKIVEDTEGPVVTYEVWARLWNVTAEWKHIWQAEGWADLIRKERPEIKPDDVEVVGRNSRREHQLRAYGKLLLPA